ncbi:hypothetical protein NST20_13050 [Weizmannia sp. FSL W8-0676]
MKIKKGKTELYVTEKAFNVIYKDLGFKVVEGDQSGSAGTQDQAENQG